MNSNEIKDVCPHCKRSVNVVFLVQCDGHAIPAVWRCAEHGAVTPMRSAVANDYADFSKKAA